MLSRRNPIGMNPTLHLRSLAILSGILVGFLPATATAQQFKRKTIGHVRYVRIELPGKNRILSLAEVQVIRDGRNIASHGVASQSATDLGGLPGRAIDGGTSGDFNEGSVTHTLASAETWWELDLGNSQSVEQVNIWNRTDCCGERLNNFTLLLLDRRRGLLFERKGLRAPNPRTDYLMTGESVVAGAHIEDVVVSVERRQKLQPAVNSAIENGVRYLKDTQLRDGSWSHSQIAKYRSGPTALSLYALVKCGVPRTDPAVLMGLRYLLQNPPNMTYSIGVVMLLYETLADEDLQDELRGFLERLIETQHASGNIKGLWGYPAGCDLSTTQYGALGLLAAQRAGLEVPREVYRNLLEGILRNQSGSQIVSVQREVGESGTGEIRMAGWGYRPTPAQNPTHSMTTAGISIIAICQRGLEAKKGATDMGAANAGKRMGLEWLHRNFSLNVGKWNSYYYYGLERVGALLGVDYIGGKHWYWEGSEALVRSQGKQGQWGNEADTCFALLFLTKASASGAVGSGPRLKLPEDVRISDGPNVDIQWRATGTKPVTMWITGFNENMVKEFSEADGLVKGLRVTRVDYLCDDEVIKTFPVDVGQGWKKEDTFAYQHEFTEPGTHRLEVLVRLVDPLSPEGGSSETEILSMPLEVYVRDQFSIGAIEAPIERKAPNLLNGVGVTPEVSTHLGKGYEVLKAIDGFQSTKWLSAKDEATPTLTFNFDEPVRANTLVLSDANSSLLTSETYDHPTRIEVNINKRRNPKYIEITKGVLSNWTLSFKTTRLRSLEIRILGREPGTTGAGVVGFSEVELLFNR